MADDKLAIVIIARDIWGDTWRRRHFLAHEWSKTRTVVFVEPPFPVARSLFGLAGPSRTSLTRALSASRRPRKVDENLFVASPLKWLPVRTPGAGNINFPLQRKIIRRALKALEINRYVVWCNPEYGVHLLPGLSPELVVYDVTDDWTKTTLPRRQISAIEQDDRLMLGAADIVFAVSRKLYEKKRAVHPNTYLLPNGFLEELYKGELPEPRDLRTLQRPTLGYVGTLHPQRIDTDLIVNAVNAAREDYSIALVGPNLLTGRQQAALRRTGRVRFLGEKNRLEIPAYIAGFDACLIPHVVDAFTASLNPIKIYEYLAAGKPVVSTVTAGMEEFAEFLCVPDSPENFVREALRLAGEGAAGSGARRAAVREHTWAARAARAASILENATRGRSGRTLKTKKPK